jgi:hypothetical protein
MPLFVLANGKREAGKGISGKLLRFSEPDLKGSICMIPHSDSVLQNVKNACEAGASGIVITYPCDEALTLLDNGLEDIIVPVVGVQTFDLPEDCTCEIKVISTQTCEARK